MGVCYKKIQKWNIWTIYNKYYNTCPIVIWFEETNLGWATVTTVYCGGTPLDACTPEILNGVPKE